MKKYLLSLFCFAMILLNFNYGYSQNKPEIDYGGLNMARQSLSDENYILAYKYLIIFKYTNIQRLHTKENSEILSKIDSKINEIEDCLLQNYSVIDEKKTRGFTDFQIDSAFKARNRKIVVQNIIIN